MSAGVGACAVDRNEYIRAIYGYKEVGNNLFPLRRLLMKVLYRMIQYCLS
jgi:hypothetical protein